MSSVDSKNNQLFSELSAVGLKVGQDSLFASWRGKPLCEISAQLALESMDALYEHLEELKEAFSERGFKVIVTLDNREEVHPEAYERLFKLIQSQDFPTRGLELERLQLDAEEARMVGLADALENSKIHSVSLKDSGIDDIGAGLIAQAIRTNQYIRELWLDDNQIGPVGTQELADVIPGKECGLKTLSVAGNPITYDGGQALVKAASQADSLSQLIFGFGNFQSASEWAAIRNSCEWLSWRRWQLNNFYQVTGLGKGLVDKYGIFGFAY